MDNTESHNTVDVLTDIPWQLLEEITNNFSENQIIGKGGFGIVYKAVYQNGREIAVKKLYYMPGLDEKQYQNELQNLTGLHHRNIVQLIGKGYKEQKRLVEHDGRYVMAYVIDRAICLEYVVNGSLQQLLSDEHSGLHWHKCYKLIKGISEGLKYLHEHSIFHLDLKPANILLDSDMIPKIADFGLSRLFSGTRQSHTTSHSIGTRPYMPPEFIEMGKISDKFDVFSLGVIIIQIMTGPDGYSIYADTPSQEFVKRVHGNWKRKLHQTECGDASYLDAYCNQVKTCLDIAVKSLQLDRHKRPKIEAIIDNLNGTESTIDEMYKKLFVVNPLKLRFPFKPDKMIPCPLHLTNKTDQHIRFRIQPRTPDLFAGSLNGVVPAKSTQTYILKMQAQQQAPSNVDSILIQSYIDSDFHGVRGRDSDFDHRRTHHEMIDVMTTSFLDSSSQPKQEIISLNCCNSIDVHPMKPWILIRGAHGEIHIWNYRTKAKLDLPQLQPTGDSTVAKFVPRKQLLVVGDSEGYMDVYCHNTMQLLKHFKAHQAGCIKDLAVHPTKPYVLSASEDEGNIKLWDWENGWECTRIFEFVNAHVYQVVIVNDNTFAISGDAGIKICSLRCDESNRRVGISRELLPVESNSASKFILDEYDYQGRSCQFDFFANGDGRYLIMGGSDGTVKIRELHRNSRSWTQIRDWLGMENNPVQTVKGVHFGTVTAVCSHFKTEVLATGSIDGTVCLWNSTALRPEITFNFDLGRVNDVKACLDDSTKRLVIAHNEGLAMIEMDRNEPTEWYLETRNIIRIIL